MPNRRIPNRYYTGRHEHHRKQRIWFRRISIILPLVLLFFILALPFWAADHVEIDTKALTSADLPKDVGTLRIVYLSDLHTGKNYNDKQAQEIVRTVNNLNPDLLLLGGDYAADTDSAINFFQNAPRFHARYAVCGVFGEHDRAKSESLQALKNAMSSAGVRPLCNSVESIRIGSGSVIYVAGLDDSTVGQPDVTGLAANFRADDYVILLSHNPSVISSALSVSGADGKTNWFDLGLFGHTLGGKVPFVGKLIMNLS